jgi:hypothetical protein
MHTFRTCPHVSFKLTIMIVSVGIASSTEQIKGRYQVFFLLIIIWVRPPRPPALPPPLASMYHIKRRRKTKREGRVGAIVACLSWLEKGVGEDPNKTIAKNSGSLLYHRFPLRLSWGELERFVQYSTACPGRSKEVNNKEQPSYRNLSATATRVLQCTCPVAASWKYFPAIHPTPHLTSTHLTPDYVNTMILHLVSVLYTAVNV